MSTLGDLDPEAHVRALFAAYARGGPNAMCDLVGDDVEWRPLSGDGRRIEHHELMGDWGREHVDRVSAIVHGFETRGGHVVAHGSLRTFREGGFVDVQPSWVFFFEDRRLVRAVGYRTREEAIEAIDALSA